MQVTLWGARSIDRLQGNGGRHERCCERVGAARGQARLRLSTQTRRCTAGTHLLFTMLTAALEVR